MTKSDMGGLVVGAPGLYLITWAAKALDMNTNRSWDSDVPLALVEATSQEEALDIFWSRTDAERVGGQHELDKEEFSATPVLLENGYRWIGATG